MTEFNLKALSFLTHSLRHEKQWPLHGRFAYFMIGSMHIRYSPDEETLSPQPPTEGGGLSMIAPHASRPPRSISPASPSPAQRCARTPRGHRQAIPKHKLGMIGGFLSYGNHCKTPSGCEGDTGVMAPPSQKQYISLYLGCPYDGESLAEKNKARLGKVNVGKCCIRFQKLEDINLKVAMELVKESARQRQHA